MSKPWDHLLEPKQPVVTKLVEGSWRTHSPYPITVVLKDPTGGSAGVELLREGGGSTRFYPNELEEVAEFCITLAAQLRLK